MEIIRFCLHYGMHFLLPVAIAYIFFRQNWVKVWLLMVATILIDLDHLLATPIFQEDRCSINFHPLHTYYALAFYILLLFFKKSKVIGIALILHLVTDYIDCLWM